MLRLTIICFLIGKYSFLYYLSILRVFKTSKPKLLRSFLEETGGSFIKFGQLLALRIDVLPKEYVFELIDMFDHVKPFSYKDAEAIMLYELGVTPDKIFSEFEQEPFASASFGQVHAARLKTGETLIVKIQRPGIEEKVFVDFFIINLLAIIGDLFFKIEALPWREFAKEFREWTLKELDYQLEAENAQTIYTNVAKRKTPGVIIPKTYFRYTTKRILVQEYIDGVPLSRIFKELKWGSIDGKKLNAMGIDLKASSRTLVFEMLRQYFFDGIYHADPHPGNILLLENGGIAFIDFGITGEPLPKKDIFMEFVKAACEDDYKKASYYFLEFAGDDIKQMIGSALPATVDEDKVNAFIHLLAEHFTREIERTQGKIKKDLEVKKTDYSVMVMQMIKYAQRYNIKLPSQIIVFLRTMTMIGFLLKEMDYRIYMRYKILDFFKEYPEIKNFKREGEETPIPYKRINQEEAIERLSNWLTYLIEIDPKLYTLVQSYITNIEKEIQHD